MKRGIKDFWIAFVIVILLMILIPMFMNTGFLQQRWIDSRDLANWKYDQDGIILGNEGFTLNGTSGQCWVMSHGYTTTPDELRMVANAVHERFNDTVYVPRLLGHATVPSNIEKYSVDDWYNQVSGLMQEHNCSFILGTSMSANLILRYIEKHSEVRGAVIVGLTLNTRPHWFEPYIRYFVYPVAGYVKKSAPGETVLDPEGKKAHVSVYNFPLKGAVELFDFNKDLVRDIVNVHTEVLFMMGTKDVLSDKSSVLAAYDTISADKEFYWAEGAHIVFRDYSKQKAVDKVLEFRGSFR